MVRRGIVVGVPGVRGAGVVAAIDVRLVAVVGLARLVCLTCCWLLAVAAPLTTGYKTMAARIIVSSLIRTIT